MNPLPPPPKKSAAIYYGMFKTILHESKLEDLKLKCLFPVILAAKSKKFTNEVIQHKIAFLYLMWLKQVPEWANTDHLHGQKAETLRLPYTSAGVGQGLRSVPSNFNYSLINTLLFIEERLFANVSYNYIVNRQQ